LTLVTAGRVGKPHGLDGSFYVERPRHELPEGAEVTLAGHAHRIVRRAGTDERPLIRLAGVDDPGALGGELLLVEDELGQGEWLASDLVGLSVPGLGKVAQPIRVAISGTTVSPPIFQSLELLGRERTFARITRCVARAGSAS